MYISRLIKKDMQKKLAREKTKIIILYGARQTGKTFLAEDILKNLNKKILRLSGDEEMTARALSSRSLEKMKNIVSGYDILFLDEAQRIENIGINLKILHDKMPELKIIVTGSSSFDLISSIKEPLTGRAWTFHLHPVAISELAAHFTPHEIRQQLDSRLVFGSYPEIFSLKTSSDRRECASSLASDYLYKDFLEFEGIKNSKKIKSLLKLLAFQIGSEVSFTELGGRLEINKKTVERYIDLLEKFFVIFSLSGFSRNLRKEVTKKPKVYFWDLGIRNAVINNFNLPADRNDTGALWENFVIAERLKRNSYSKRLVSSYFWRTYTGAELDYVEEGGGRLRGYEIKQKKTARAPAAWLDAYQAGFKCVNKENILEFICPQETAR